MLVYSNLRLQDLQPFIPIDQVEFTVLVMEDVVAHDNFLIFAWVRHIVADLFRRIWIGEIDGDLRQLRGESARLSRPGTVNVDELMEINRFELLLSAERQAAVQQQKLVAEEVERRRLALVAADREVRVLERLRETGQERHRQEVDRQERKEMDESAMHAFVRKDR